MPGIIGSTGWDRSSAWIWDFSSTHSTTALSGGLWYRPTTSTTFSMNSGSVEILNPSVRCGLRSNLRQIRPMVDLDRALRLAHKVRDQGGASFAVSSFRSGDLDPVGQVRLEVELAPDPPDGGPGQAAAPGHRGPGPVRGVLRGLLQRRGDDVLDLVQQDRRRPARARLIGEPVAPLLGEPPPPPGHRPLGHPQFRGDLVVVLAVGAGQHDPGPQRQRLRGPGPPRPPGQLRAFLPGQLQPGLRPPAALRVGQARQPGSGVLAAPLADRDHGDAQTGCDLPVHRARRGARQHDPGPRPASARLPGPGGESLAILLGQLQAGGTTSHAENYSNLYIKFQA